MHVQVYALQDVAEQVYEGDDVHDDAENGNGARSAQDGATGQCALETAHVLERELEQRCAHEARRHSGQRERAESHALGHVQREDV